MSEPCLVLASAGFHPTVSVVAWIPGLKQAPRGMTVLVGRRYNQNRPNLYLDQVGFTAIRTVTAETVAESASLILYSE